MKPLKRSSRTRRNCKRLRTSSANLRRRSQRGIRRNSRSRRGIYRLVRALPPLTLMMKTVTTLGCSSTSRSSTKVFSRIGLCEHSYTCNRHCSITLRSTSTRSTGRKWIRRSEPLSIPIRSLEAPLYLQLDKIPPCRLRKLKVRRGSLEANQCSREGLKRRALYLVNSWTPPRQRITSISPIFARNTLRRREHK